MGHDHHDHHDHAPKDFGLAFAVATRLNFALVATQVIYGLSAHSIALLADAGHNFGDALGLLLAWGAHVLARRRPSERFTYGLRSASILSALINAVMLLVATGAIAWEAFRRFSDPGEVAGLTVMVVAGIAVIANAVVSVGVVLAGAVILLFGWVWIDPLVSLLIAGVIVWTTWGLLRESLQMSMNAVPAAIEPSDVCGYLETLPGVASIHDLHIWAMSTTEIALTCHLVMPQGHPGDGFIARVSHDLAHRFQIAHPTFQIELGDGEPCPLAPAHVV